MVRAAGSYPAGRWFESDRRYHYTPLPRPLGQAVKTSPFHGGNTSSSLVGVTKLKRVNPVLSGLYAFFHYFLCPLSNHFAGERFSYFKGVLPQKISGNYFTEFLGNSIPAHRIAPKGAKRFRTSSKSLPGGGRDRNKPKLKNMNLHIKKLCS